MISKRYFIKKAQDQAPVGVEDSGSSNASESSGSVSVVENDPELNAASNANVVKHNELAVNKQMQEMSKGMPLPVGMYWVIPSRHSREVAREHGMDPVQRRGYGKPGAVAIGIDRNNQNHFLKPHYVSLDGGKFKLKPLRERPYESDRYIKGNAILTDEEIDLFRERVPSREQKAWKRYLRSLSKAEKRRLTGGDRNWIEKIFSSSDETLEQDVSGDRHELQKFYVDKSMLESLMKLANELDKKGSTKEANLLDQIVSRAISQKGQDNEGR